MKEFIDCPPHAELGYYFYPPRRPDFPGHPGMEVILNATPTYRHYDPQKASYPAVLGGKIARLVISHPWTQASRFRICAGRVRLTDHAGKVVEAFTLGGSLLITCDAQRTICRLTSPAPIFPLYAAMDLSMCLTAEMEILLAEQKAHWNRDHHYTFAERLAAVDPLALYACLLDALHRMGSGLHTGSGQLDCDVRHFIEGEIAELKEDKRWPDVVCTPDQLLLD